MFVRLAVFPGAFDLDQVERVCADDQLPRPAVGPLLARLADQSLVQTGGAGSGCWRRCGRTRASNCSPADDAVVARPARRRHRASGWRRSTSGSQQPDEPAAVTAIAHAEPGPARGLGLRREHDRRLAVQLAADVHDFTPITGNGSTSWSGGWRWPRWETGHPRLGDALASAAAAAWASGRVDDAGVLADRGRRRGGRRQLPRGGSRDEPVRLCGHVQSRTADAVDRFARAAELFRAAGDPCAGSCAMLSVSQVMSYGGAAAEAAERMPDLLARARETANPSLLAWTFYVLGEALADVDRERAAAAWASAMEHGMRADNRLFVNLARTSAVASAAGRGSPAAALDEFERVLDQWEAIGSQAAQWWVLVNLVILLARLGAFDDAARLAGSAIAARDRHPALARDRRRLEQTLGTVRENLGDLATDEALALGAGLPVGRRGARTGGDPPRIVSNSPSLPDGQAGRWRGEPRLDRAPASGRRKIYEESAWPSEPSGARRRSTPTTGSRCSRPPVSWSPPCWSATNSTTTTSSASCSPPPPTSCRSSRRWPPASSAWATCR